MSGSFSHEDLQSVGPLSAVPELLRRFGVSPAAVLAAAGLSSTALDVPQATIPYASVGLLLEAAAKETQCAHFGLELGKQIRTGSLGLVGQLMRNAPTLGAALRDFAENQHRNAHGAVAYLLPVDDHVFWGYAVYHPNARGYEMICDWAAMAGINVLSELIGSDHKQIAIVLLARSEPEDLAPYFSALGVKLRFNAEQSAIRLPKAVLNHRVPGADAELRKELDKRVAALWHAGGLDVVTHLRRILRVGLISGQVNLDEITRQMHMTRRTLHRRLAADGLRFQDVLDETRSEFARQLLAHTRLSIGDVATIVGYADPSILTRSFVRWTGFLPSEWRSSIGALHSMAGA